MDSSFCAQFFLLNPAQLSALSPDLSLARSLGRALSPFPFTRLRPVRSAPLCALRSKLCAPFQFVLPPPTPHPISVLCPSLRGDAAGDSRHPAHTTDLHPFPAPQRSERHGTESGALGEGWGFAHDKPSAYKRDRALGVPQFLNKCTFSSSVFRGLTRLPHGPQLLLRHW